MKISVVTPSYNQGQFLRETLESVHQATVHEIEHIVIDGGSTDDSVAIIEEYADRLAYWVSEPDGGQTDALIKGFEMATGDVLCWLNSDDMFEPTTLDEVASIFESDRDLGFIYGDATWIDAGGEFVKAKREHGFNRFVWLYDHNFIPQPSTFWRADLYRGVGGLDRRYDLAMDADLWIRLADQTEPRHYKRNWSRMRFYPEQKTSAMKGESIDELSGIRDRYTTDSAFGRLVKQLAARALRVGLKLAVGGYSIREAVNGAQTLLGGASWETRELDRVRQSGTE